MSDWYEPPLKYPRPFIWRKPDRHGKSEIHPDNPTLHPCWDMIFVDWITEMALSTEELNYYYAILNNTNTINEDGNGQNFVYAQDAQGQLTGLMTPVLCASGGSWSAFGSTPIPISSN